MNQRHSIVAAIYLIFQKKENVLFLRRLNTGFRDGELTFPAGHVDEGEPIIAAAIREAQEEVGVVVTESQLQLVHVMDRNAADFHRLDFYFTCDAWEGDIQNMEPHKCSEMLWAGWDNLPVDMLPNVCEAVACIQGKTLLSQQNWHGK